MTGVLPYLFSAVLFGFGVWLGVRCERARFQIAASLATFNRDVAVNDEAENGWSL